MVLNRGNKYFPVCDSDTDPLFFTAKDPDPLKELMDPDPWGKGNKIQFFFSLFR